MVYFWKALLSTGCISLFCYAFKAPKGLINITLEINLVWLLPHVHLTQSDYAERYSQSQAQVLSLGTRLEELTEFAKEKESTSSDLEAKNKRVAESLQMAYKVFVDSFLFCLTLRSFFFFFVSHFNKVFYLNMSGLHQYHGA